MSGKKALALAGFVIIGLSPSFVDWQQSPDQRPKIVIFYVIGLMLIYFGLLED